MQGRGGGVWRRCLPRPPGDEAAAAPGPPWLQPRGRLQTPDRGLSQVGRGFACLYYDPFNDPQVWWGDHLQQ